MRYLMALLALLSVGCADRGDMFQPVLFAQTTDAMTVQQSVDLEKYALPDLAPGAEGGRQLAEWVRNTMAAGVDPYQVLHEQHWERSDQLLKTISAAIDETAQPSDTEDGPYTNPWWYAVYNKATGKYDMDSATIAKVKWWHDRN